MQGMKQIGPQRYRETYGRYYEDFTVGDVYEHRPGRTLTETDNILVLPCLIRVIEGATVGTTKQLFDLGRRHAGREQPQADHQGIP